MQVLLDELLVIGVSSRALFNLEAENLLFDTQGVEAYKRFQVENEKVPLSKGTAFPLISCLLSLNKQTEKRLVEVVILSRNSPETATRVMHSLRHYNLDISRMAFSGGTSLSPYIKAFSVDLFLSKEAKDVQQVIDSKACAAACLFDPPEGFEPEENTVKIAFDADAVIFSEDSELIYKRDGMKAFHQHEWENEHKPMSEGPFASLLIKLSKLQNELKASQKQHLLRLAIVTARNAPAHLRVIHTLNDWGVSVDEAYFLGGISKENVLKALSPHIFFDDQEIHLLGSSKIVPSGKVPYTSLSPLFPKDK